MLRICLCLMFAVASASVPAREVKMSTAAGGEICDEHADKKPARTADAATKPASPRETKAKPSVHGDAGPTGRVQSPRWHSFLPGMFR